MSKVATKNQKLIAGRPVGSWIFIAAAVVAIVYLLFFYH